MAVPWITAEIAAGNDHVLLVTPTGSGKTVIAAAIIAEAPKPAARSWS